MPEMKLLQGSVWRVMRTGIRNGWKTILAIAFTYGLMLPDFAYSLTVPTPVASPDPLPPEAVSEVANHLIGVMDTSQQAATNSDFVSVQMTTCAIALQEPGANAVYLYQEQALSSNLTDPYRQRFLQLSLSADQRRVESRNFKPDEPERWIGLCQDSNSVTLSRSDLGTPVCTVSMRPSPLGYVGSTPAEGCPVTLRGATWLTNVIVVHADGMDTWDRGFNDAGAQLWGADTEPYRYRWVEAEHEI